MFFSFGFKAICLTVLYTSFGRCAKPGAFLMLSTNHEGLVVSPQNLHPSSSINAPSTEGLICTSHLVIWKYSFDRKNKIDISLLPECIIWITILYLWVNLWASIVGSGRGSLCCQTSPQHVFNLFPSQEHLPKWPALLDKTEILPVSEPKSFLKGTVFLSAKSWFWKKLGICFLLKTSKLFWTIYRILCVPSLVFFI